MSLHRDVQHWLAGVGHRPHFEDELVAFPKDLRRPRRLVEPRRIARGINLRLWSREQRARLLVGGTWQTKPRPVVKRTVRQLFVEGLPYTETDQFTRMVETVESGAAVWNYRCESVADVHAYFGRLVAAYESMRAEGYLSQEELGGHPEDEVRLYIAPRGELLIGGGGNHRVVMAHLLGLDHVLAIVAGMHIRWARSCYDRWGGPLTDAIYHGLDDLPGMRPETPRERRERRARARTRARPGAARAAEPARTGVEAGRSGHR